LCLAAGVGPLALALVLPTAVYALLAFRPPSPEAFAQAQAILSDFRIPHHTRVDLWLDPVAGLQIAWIVLAAALAWRTRLFAVLAVPFVLGLLLTVAQVVTGSRTLALLFPWRVSAVLVPVATAVVLTRLVQILPRVVEGWWVWSGCAGVALACAAGGVWICVARLGFLSGAEEAEVLKFVRGSRQKGYVYFVPVTVPDLARTTRGSLSSDFKPLPDKRQDARVIPVDFQGFRLATGAAIFVDFKSIPYWDAEVLDWHARVRLAQEVQSQIREGRIHEALDRLRDRGVTHVVLARGRGLPPDEAEEKYSDNFYIV